MFHPNFGKCRPIFEIISAALKCVAILLSEISNHNRIVRTTR